VFLAKTSLVAFPRRDANTPTPTTKCQQLSARRPRGCDRRSGRPIRICRACLWNPAWGPRAQQKSASSYALRRARRHLADVCKYLLLFARRTKLLVAHRLGAACGGDAHRGAPDDPFVGKRAGARQRGTQSPQRRAPRGHPGGASRGRAPARGATVSEAEAAVLHGLSQQLASAQGAQCRRLCGGNIMGLRQLTQPGVGA
jgi:hypothetical protein